MLGARSRTVEHVHNVFSSFTMLSYRAPNVVAVSEHVRLGLLQNYPRLTDSNVSVVRNGARKHVDSPLPFAERTYDLVGIGRLEEQKNPLMFLELAHGLRSRRELKCLWLAPGPGKLEGEFLQRRAELGLNEIVKLVVGGTHEETCSYVSQAKLFVLMSKWEGLPLAALEAIGCGTPVATTSCGEIGDIVDQGACGLRLIDEMDQNTAAMTALISSEPEWGRASASAFALADGFSEATMLRAIQRVYSEINPAFANGRHRVSALEGVET